jgi:hypothetical protein
VNDFSLRHRMAAKQPCADDSSWPDVPDSVVGCMACQFDRQVYGIEIEFA